MKYFLAGGAVRDMLLGLRPKDYDYVFSGSEEEFVRLNPDAHKLGLGPTYGLHKHEFSPLGKDISANLRERDFTINCFLLAEDGTLHMHPAALADLKNGRISPAAPDSLLRDPLRVFRAARFAAEFPDFQLEQSTLELMAEAAATPEFLNIPPERVGRELAKALIAPAPGNFLRALERGGALGHWFKELAGASGIPAGPPAYHNSDVLEHTAQVMDLAAAEAAAWLQRNTYPVKKNDELAQAAGFRRSIGSDCLQEKSGELAVLPKLAKLAKLTELAVWMALAHDLGKVATPKEILPHHYQHELCGVEPARALAARLRLSNRLRAAGALSASLHMKAGIYERLKPSTRVDLLLEAHKKRLLLPLFLAAQADSGLPQLLEQAQAELQVILSVKLPPSWQDRKAESGKHLRELRCAALIRFARSQSEG